MNTFFNNRKGKEGLTLVEIVVAAVVLSTLTLIAYPPTQNALIKSNLAKAHADILSISKAITLYRMDHSDYPHTQHDIICCQEIQRLSVLTTPTAYLPVSPVSPWAGRRYFIDEEEMIDVNDRDYRYQTNYMVMTTNSQAKSDEPFPIHGWVVFSGGPLSPEVSPNPETWYSVTNGLISRGGLWHDSNGRTSLK